MARKSAASYFSRGIDESPSEESKTATVNLRRVLAVNHQINSTLDLDELLGIVMSTAEEVMRAEAASLMLVDEKSGELVFKVALGEKGTELVEKFRVRMGEGIAGAVAETGESVIVNDTRSDPRFASRFDEATGFSSRAILCVPLRSKGKIIGVLEAINPIGRTGFSEDDLELFECFSDQAAIAIENARLHSEIVRQEKTKQELQIAHEIQQSLLPDLSKRSFGIDIAACNIPAREVGGDFYDVIQLDESKISVIIGDVSGKGVPAALYMVRALSNYRFLAPHSLGPARLLEMLNEGLAKDASFGMFVTVLCAVVDTKKRRVQYASAGHLPLLQRCGKSGRIKVFDDGKGIPLGLEPGARYPQGKVTLAPGDVLIFYTDGVLEARDRAGAEYSLERLKESLTQPARQLPKGALSQPTDLGGPAQSASELAQRVLRDVREFTQGADPHDDITVLTLMI